MKKLFISQPMNGRDPQEIKQERKTAVLTVSEMLGEDVSEINSYFEIAPYDASPLWFLGKSIQQMANADIVYFVPGWENARGCLIERECAVSYGIDILE